MRVDRFGIFEDRLQVASATFRHRAQRFFKDGGEAARFVARRGVVVHLTAIDLGVFLPPMNAVNEFLGHFRFDGAACEQVFGAINFRCFTEDGCAAMLHQQIDGRTQSRVGADA